MNLGPIRSRIQGPLPQDFADLKIKNVLSSNDWNWAAIPFDLPKEVISNILAVPTPLVARCSDKVAWKFSPKGGFDMKSAYLLATGLMDDESFSGSWIWKLPVLPRIQLFIWKCMHHSISVKDCLASRGIPLDTTCPVCHLDFESITHALRDCRMIKPLWLKLGSQCLQANFFSQGIRDWLIANANLKSSQNATGVPWNILFSFAL